MALIINHTNEGVKVLGDDYLKTKLPADFNVNEIDLTGERIGAGLLAVAYNDAESKGIDAIKRYFAIKEKFMEQQNKQ
ncbi:hypothetical protein [Lysinibacillus antri]|uniref:Uncharacterized protein n=1 Tax=Lysinibacillus antri TaxID=2498145 RepID=A0A3S0PNS0_9BACI|nr:hypothetical protein [Lysinibacillus antri]RUL51103.1 hypothetical protein EK386_12910 [Lysinibacillus antri]